jgi:hypothetical protein
MSSDTANLNSVTAAGHRSPKRWTRAFAAVAFAAAAVIPLASPASADSAASGHVFRIALNGKTGADGSSWSRAGLLTDLPRFVQLAEPGDEVWIRGDAGAYRTTGGILLNAGGSASEPVVVRGVAANGSDRATPTFVGTRTAPYQPNGNPGTELFKLMAGADNLTFHNLAFKNQGNGAFRVGGDISNLTIKNMRATNVRRFFESNPSGGASTATVKRLRIRNVIVKGFSRGAIRLQDDTNNVVIQNVIGNSQRQDGDRFAMGIHLDDTVHNVLLTRVTMRNSRATNTGPYWNGDGFVAEGDTYNLRFVRTVATGSTDSGYDLKGDAIKVTRAVARDNKRNYRFWGQAELVNSIGRDPRSRGGIGSQAQVWAGGNARVSVSNSTFTDERSNTFVVHVESHADVTLEKVKIKKARAARGAVVEHDARLHRL